MAIEEFPFFTLLLLSILPITIGILIFTRILKIAINLVAKSKKRDGETFSLIDMGELYLFVVFLTVVIGLVYYILGDQPSGFSIFEFLILEMLPISWYSILLYGIIVNLVILLGRSSGEVG